MPIDPSDAILAIAYRLREARKRAGYSQRSAAAESDISYGALRNWEGGEVAQPGWALARLARLYGVAAEWLLAPDSSFFALVDTSAEREAVTCPGISRFGQLSQRVSVLVTEHLVPILSTKEWAKRMAKVEEHGEIIRRERHEPGGL